MFVTELGFILFKNLSIYVYFSFIIEKVNL